MRKEPVNICSRCGRQVHGISKLSETFNCDACDASNLNNVNYLGHGEKIEYAKNDIIAAIDDVKEELSEQINNTPDATVAAIQAHEGKLSTRFKNIAVRIILMIAAGLVVQFVIRMVISNL